MGHGRRPFVQGVRRLASGEIRCRHEFTGEPTKIGGSCIELEASGERIVLDLGRPLWAGRDDAVPQLPSAGSPRPIRHYARS
jgi:hypothetical protein